MKFESEAGRLSASSCSWPCRARWCAAAKPIMWKPGGAHPLAKPKWNITKSEGAVIWGKFSGSSFEAGGRRPKLQAVIWRERCHLDDHALDDPGQPGPLSFSPEISYGLYTVDAVIE